MSRNLHGSVTETSVISSVECVFMNSEIIVISFNINHIYQLNLNFIVFLITHARENSWASLEAHW